MGNLGPRISHHENEQPHEADNYKHTSQYRTVGDNRLSFVSQQTKRKEEKEVVAVAIAVSAKGKEKGSVKGSKRMYKTKA